MTSMILKSAVIAAALGLAVPALAQTGSGGSGGTAAPGATGGAATAPGAGAGASAANAPGTLNRQGGTDPATTGSVQEGPRNASCLTVMANRANYPADVVARCQGK